MKLIEVQATKEFASTFLNDIFFRMAVNRVLDAAPAFDLVRCKECKHYKPQSKSARWDCKTMYCCRSVVIKVNPEDFCSYGERKQDDGLE